MAKRAGRDMLEEQSMHQQRVEGSMSQRYYQRALLSSLPDSLQAAAGPRAVGALKQEAALAAELLYAGTPRQSVQAMTLAIRRSALGDNPCATSAGARSSGGTRPERESSLLTTYWPESTKST